MYSFCEPTINYKSTVPSFLCILNFKIRNMKSNNESKEYRDQSKESDREIMEALDRIIKRAKIENDALEDMLNKIYRKKPDEK